jgi:glycerol-3-phosphate dehydrogenase (NAD(P)+)
MSTTTLISRAVVAGGGAWGTALASVCARAGLETTLWCRSADQAVAITSSRENALYLPGYKLPEGLAVTADEAVFADAEMVVLATPAQSTRQMLALMSPHLAKRVPVIIAAKGFERETDLMLSDVVKQAAPALVPLVLSGPSFAADVVADLPTAVTLAGEDVTLAHSLAGAMSRRSFRIYVSDDLNGVQTGGAVKNVIAIAAGICSGKQLGASALAALTTRSFAELRRLAEVLGAEPDTLFGLSGLGDLILTCSSTQSRNFSLGVELGHGKPLADILASRRSVSEGVYTASVVEDLARKHGIEMPVCQAVANIVNAGADVDNEIHKLLSRPLKAEQD